MTPAPRVSFLMAAYDGEMYLDEAIQSVLNQTFTDFEFIVINDGSIDETSQIIERYRRLDGRIRAYEQPNRGLVVALNRGLELARGEYIARMDADDISVTERIATQVAFMDVHPEVGICGTLDRESAASITINPSPRTVQQAQGMCVVSKNC